MKKSIYSSLAILCACTGILSFKTKKINIPAMRPENPIYTYKYAGPLPATQHDITSINNWTISWGVSSDCIESTEIPCVIITTRNPFSSHPFHGPAPTDGTLPIPDKPGQYYQIGTITQDVPVVINALWE